MADPLLYDRLVRRFMSASEREREDRERGYSGILEADLVRSEAKIEALQHPDPNSPMAYRRAPNGSIVAVEAEDEKVLDKEEGWRMWVDYQTQRFLRGEDQNFDYSAVDENDEYDDRAEEDRSRLDQYFAQEDAEYVGEGTPKGETGIQDF
ncbi:Hypothetical predicted protein [Lecanosticta acicola]|uniref:CCD97-like C-terminal domain-containing protein n=1 Tax=Lecanosticta acicola TaxID=111012 RepID=A0AAI9ECF0_9PEZI|nr:Hypothetical predicted protein [Lecanosticta acicola]